MADFAKKNEVKDYREHFEFRLTVADNIICQRYFKINGFNYYSTASYELADTIRACAKMIEDELKQKNHIYLDAVAPRIFNSVEEMTEYFKNPQHCAEMSLGEGLVIRDAKGTNYVWGKEGAPVEARNRFDIGEFSKPLTDDDYVTFKFAFLIDGKEVMATCWETAYPKYIRNSIDLTNKRGKFEGEDLSRLSFESAVLNRMVAGRPDLVNKIVREICQTCSQSDNDWYTIAGDGYTNEIIVPEFILAAASAKKQQ